jgi:hypothetical protein
MDLSYILKEGLNYCVLKSKLNNTNKKFNFAVCHSTKLLTKISSSYQQKLLSYMTKGHTLLAKCYWRPSFPEETIATASDYD